MIVIPFIIHCEAYSILNTSKFIVNTTCQFALGKKEVNPFDKSSMIIYYFW